MEGYNIWSGSVHRWLTIQWKLQYMVRVSTKMGDHPVEGYNIWSGLVHRGVVIQWNVAIHGQGLVHRWMTIQWKVTIHGQD